MDITLIAAVAENGVIGRGNELPWRIPEDLKYFKSKTLGKPVLMGRRTWDSIGRPLPQRLNLVLSRDTTWRASGAQQVSSLDQALEVAVASGGEHAELMVIGGADVYRTALPLATRMLITRIHARPEGDVFFPAFAESRWEQVSCDRHDSLGTG